MTNNKTNLPVIKTASIPSLDEGLTRYLNEIKNFPILEAEEEYMLAKRWSEHRDPKAAEKLISSHLRLVAKIAYGYKGYGLPLGDLIAEGNVGLVQAMKKFDPDKGFRLSTYAMWWIRASIQEYILHSWSLVKIGTTTAQKKLFFNLRRLKNEIQNIDDQNLSDDMVKTISKELNVSEKDVVAMDVRMSGKDHSLNAPVTSMGENEWQDWLVDETIDQETQIVEQDELQKKHLILADSLNALNKRELYIIQNRRLREDPLTLEELAAELGVSRERVRQIEVKAFEKLQNAVKQMAIQHRL